ncbi:unnamed protein product [Peniophora sp. CBMAI 1063]|nr:unnamed protein product [Peniophora sp. CBMAI 1063]
MTNALSRSYTIQAAQHVSPPDYTIASRSPVPAVLYIATVQELDAALADFEGPYGFDCEWKCMPASNRIALVQLSNGSKVLLIHVSAMPEFPSRLKALLEDATVAKVGVFVEGDGTGLKNDYNVSAKNLVNLGPLAWRVDERFRYFNRPRGTSLAKTVVHFLGQVLPKGPVRIGNWERRPLTEEQREYAACDAHCAWEVYKLLSDRAKAGNINLSNCGHVVNLDTVVPYEFPDSYPLAQHTAPSGLTDNEYHAYVMWYQGYSAIDILQTMSKYQVSDCPSDEVAVISLVVSALAECAALPFAVDDLRAFIEGNPQALKQHEVFLAMRCPAPVVEAEPVASSSTPAVAGKKRKARERTPEDYDVVEPSTTPGATLTAALPIPRRRSARLQAISSQESDGSRPLKRARTSTF